MDADRTSEDAPRLAASVLIVRDDPFSVLIIRRGAGLRYPSALVFPGGLVEPQDHAADWLALIDADPRLDDMGRALRIGACRETWEETGILLADSALRPGGCDARAFLDVVRGSGGRLRLRDLHRVGHWITPPGAPRRFDTHFFLAHVPADTEARCDGGEAVDLEWIEPREALARCAAGERRILFPTRMNLKLLAESTDARSAITAAQARPVVTVMPQVEQREDATVIRIPEAAGYGETVDILPRAGPR